MNRSANDVAGHPWSSPSSTSAMRSQTGLTTDLNTCVQNSGGPKSVPRWRAWAVTRIAGGEM
eukprot:4011009-Alexandrium_andersonii.AAC.1